MKLLLAALLLLQDKSIERLIEQLRSEKPENVTFAFEALKESGKAAEPALIQTLSDTEPRVRRDCLRILTSFKSSAALKRAREIFEGDGDSGVREEAFALLEALGVDSEDAFLANLKAPRSETRLQSVIGLRNLKSRKALEPVAELFLGESPPDIRAVAADYLESQGMLAEKVLLKGLSSQELTVRLSSIRTLGTMDSVKAHEAISRFFQEDKNAETHEACFAFLSHLGIKAENELILALDDEDKAMRVRAVVALGEARSEHAIPRLLELMTSQDPRMKAAAEDALASIGPKALEDVNKGVASGRLSKATLGRIESKAIRIEVERLLEAQIGEDEFTGFFDGQFTKLEAFGPAKAVPVLIQILNDPNYIFQHAAKHERLEGFRSAMKELAIMALGELGGEGALPALKSFATGEAFGKPPSRIQEETLVALHRLGETKPLDDYLHELREGADRLLKGGTDDQKDAGCDQLFSLGLLFTRLRKHKEATQVYLEILSATDQHKLENTRLRTLPSTYYNLACISALQGERAKAVEWLEKAVRAGFRDRSWIKGDRDLDSIRNEDGYKKLLADDSLFEKGR